MDGVCVCISAHACTCACACACMFMFAVVHGSYRIRMMSSCQRNSMGTIKSFQAEWGRVE